jgi:D-sedoheptulose 7-phosphate isomerase
LTATAAATERGARTWALTGPGPNPLAAACAEAVCLPGDTSTVQEAHLAALHMLCRATEIALAERDPAPALEPVGTPRHRPYRRHQPR